MEKELFKKILGELIDLKYENMEPLEILEIAMGAVSSFAKQNSLAFNFDIPCQRCGGMGEIPAMGRVYPNEPHMADVDSEPCPSCRPARDENDNDDQG
jgi:hypothetical protein